MQHNRFLIAIATAALFLSLAPIRQAGATDYYTYCDAEGKLVLSNKKPPEGSKIIKKQQLQDGPKEESNGGSESTPKLESGEQSKTLGSSPVCTEQPKRRSTRTSMLA